MRWIVALLALAVVVVVFWGLSLQAQVDALERRVESIDDIREGIDRVEDILRGFAVSNDVGGK